jgi:hypothetical protein
MNITNCFKYRPGEGKIWSVIFNHPLRLSSNGEKGRWTRRSLKTADSKNADEFINEMKNLLSNEELWKGENGKLMAEKKYSQVVTSAFYDSIFLEDFKDNDSTPIRENLLPLPSSDDGYNKVLLVGITGAGKSTLLRKFIGTRSESFPLTTTGKATVSDLEVIIAKGKYKAVATFITKPVTELYVQECVFYAILKALNEGEKKKIFEELSEKKDQTFRLKHILGNFRDKKLNLKESPVFDDEESDDSEESKDLLYDIERSNKINEYLDRIIQIASELKLITWNKESDSEKISKNVNLDSESLHEDIYSNKDFISLVNEIMKDIELRFNLVNKGIHLRDKWPQYWEFETKNRKEFFDSLLIFYSNNHKLFGRLLTPLVQGMRVQGPFYSESKRGEYPKLVFFDGQGIGHTTEFAKALSLPQRVENKFSQVDVILLVDNATIPVQHSSVLVLKSIFASGCTERLTIAFTHFDLVEGDNFSSRTDRKTHVYYSLKNVLSNLKKDIGPIGIEHLEADLSKRCFFLENINKSESEIGGTTLKELEKLLKQLQINPKQTELEALKPQYDDEIFYDEIYSSIEKFRMIWDMRLSGEATTKYDSYFDPHGASKEHWRRIWALNRRIAIFGITEYDDLRPVSELKNCVSDQISLYLDYHLKWESSESSDKEKFEFTEGIKRIMSSKLTEDIIKEMMDKHIEYWKNAFGYSGTGSSRLRSGEINRIYDEVSPLKKRSPNWREYIAKIKTMLDDSIALVYEAAINQSTEIQYEPSNFIAYNELDL